MRKNERGIGLLNIILVFLIIIFALFISIILYAGSSNNNTSLESNYVEPQTAAEKRYFYNQINTGSKLMYDTILQNISKLRDGTSTIDFPQNDEISEDNFQTAWDALSLDRPEIYYLETSKIALMSKKSVYFGISSITYSIEPRDNDNYYKSSFSTQSDIDLADAKLSAIINNIKTTATGTRYNKIKYIHDLLIDTIEYDETKSTNNDSIYGGLIEKKAVCEGYSNTFKYLLDQLEIPCVTVFGNAIDSDGTKESHAWNYVKMEDDNWYAVDTTWDDPIIIGRGSVSKDLKTKYFLIGSNEFWKNHEEDKDVSGTGQNFTYPVLSATNYKK